jgi:predicted peptidase
MLALASVALAQPASDLKALNLLATGGVQLNPAFARDTTQYTVSVPGDIGMLEVQAASTPGNTIRILVNGQAPDAGTPTLAPLKVGDNTIEVAVVPSDGRKVVTYTIKATREDLAPVARQFLKCQYTDPVSGRVMPYRLFVPEAGSVAGSCPMVVFLHGGGERGDDNEAPLLGNQGGTIWARPEEQALRPCFVLVPQSRNTWDGGFARTRGRDNRVDLSNIFVCSDDLKTVQGLLDTVLAAYPGINPKRLYLTGLSQGGAGTWIWNMAKPHLFAAMVPVCGAGDPAEARVLAKKPIWAFHSEADPVIPVQLERDLIKAVQAAGGKPIYTEFPRGTYFYPMAHFAWVPAYQNRAMREWLFRQKLD